MFDDGLGDMGRDVLAFIAGVGILGIVLFFWFFMRDSMYQNIYVVMVFVIILATLMVMFYLFDEIEKVYAWAMIKDETGMLKDKLRRWTNLLSGMLLMGLVGINIIAFIEYSFGHGFRILVITCLTSFSVFLFLFALFMEN